MRYATIFVIAVLISLAASMPASAQTSVSEGIRAMAAGDYVTAAKVFQPMAERAQDADPLAQFFLAILTTTGQGVYGNPFLACSLFLRAASPANPFMNQSLALADDIRGTSGTSVAVGPDIPTLCTVELDPRLPPTAIRNGTPPGRVETILGEGIDAFAATDYTRAAESFAESLKLSRADGASAFFLGAMYENGLGVPSDRMRACASYVQASHTILGPFGRISQSFVQSIRRQMSQDEFDDCAMYATLGFDTRFRPETFWLEPGHSISLDLRGATITSGGRDTRIRLSLGVQGAVFLPLQHTELMVGPLRSTRRHFIEVFMWVPNTSRQDWTLLWRLFEVNGDRLEGITGEELTKAQMPEPPAESELDVRRFVQLRVNDNGEAEWALFEGPRPRSDVIDTDEERQAATAAARAAREAEARVDWTRVVDVHRAPSFDYPAVDGCGNIFIDGWSADRTEAITVHADKELLQLSTAPVSFDSATHRSGIEVTIHAYDRAVRTSPFCTDMVMAGPPEDTWTMVRGMVTITLSPPGVVKRMPLYYRATIQVTGGQFVSSSGARITQQGPIALTAMVGTMGP